MNRVTKRLGAGLLTAVLGCVGLGGCAGPDDETEEASAQTAEVHVPFDGERTPDGRFVRDLDRSVVVEPGLRAAWIRSMQDEPGPEYSFREADGALRATPPAGDLAVEASADAIVITDSAGEAPITVGLRRVAERPVPAPTRAHDGARVTFERPGIEEWYAHGPLGVEQGFVVERDLVGDAERLVLDVAVEADGYERAGTDEALVLARDGRRVSVRDLYATDASGEPLEATMAWRGADLRIEVDVRSAAWPVLVDPMYSLQQTLRPGDAAADEWFGYSVDIDGSYAVIGSRLDDSGAASGGSAYVFVRSGSTWAEQAELIASDVGPGDWGGASVAIDGSTVAFSAPGWDCADDDCGAVYVFTRSGTTWTQQQRLTASDASELAYFGGFFNGIALDGNTLLIGARGDDPGGTVNAGSAYVFARSGSTWTEQTKLVAADADMSDEAGYAVALEGSTAVFGATGDDEAAGNAGAVYVFTGSGMSWSQQAKLTASDAQGGDLLGFGLDLDGDTLVAGAMYEDTGGSDAGSAYVFVRSGSTWSEEAILRNPDPNVFELMGWTVALSGDVVAVGAQEGTGTVEIFERSGVSWSFDRTIAPPETGARFGCDVAYSGTSLLVGAHVEDESSDVNNGAAYVYVEGFCGDGTTGPGEECDLGTAVNGTDAACCSGTCTLRTSSHVCRESAGDCDPEEVCAGAATCPADARYDSAEVCRPSTGGCDPEETCDGSRIDCPADVISPMGTVCRAAAGPCDVDETCSGSSADCPFDGFALTSTVCRAAAGPCDVAELCTGSEAACPPNLIEPMGTVCRAATGACDATEVCSGVAGDCPADAAAPDGTSCADATVCDGDEACLGGSCMGGAPLDCDDANACTADMCVEPGGCASTRIAGCCNIEADCDDGDVCTSDTCSGPGGTCSASPITNCCVADADCDDSNVCTTNACDLSTNRCTSAPVPGCCVADADCDDSNACTTDTCDTATGSCTNAEVAGCCLGDGDCNDDNTCTMDACDPSTNTCTHDPLAGCCLADDECDDMNACTTDTCDAATAMCAFDDVAGCCLEDADSTTATPAPPTPAPTTRARTTRSKAAARTPGSRWTTRARPTRALATTRGRPTRAAPRSTAAASTDPSGSTRAR